MAGPKRDVHASNPRDRRERRNHEQRLKRAEKIERRRTKMMATWTCHICGEERPDDLIDVMKADTSAEHGLPPGTMIQNVRYCNDKPECAIGARTFRHVQPPQEVSDDPADTSASN